MPEINTMKPHRFGRTFEIVFIMISVVFSLFLVELSYRIYIFFQYAVQANYAVSIVDAKSPKKDISAPGNLLGLFPRDRIYTVQNITPENTIRSSHKIFTNNLGWTSRYNLSPKKEEGEFRIIIVGGSTTAAVTNEYAWTDVAHEQLSRDLDLLKSTKYKKISVMGMGSPGANLGNIAHPLAIMAKRLEADLLVLNISIEHIIAQGSFYDFDTMRYDAQADLAAIPATLPPPTEDPPSDLNINGVGIDLVCSTWGKRTVADPNCRLSPIWYVPAGTKLSAEQILAVKRAAARTRLVHSVLLSTKPLVLMELLGRPIVPRANAQTGSERLVAETAALLTGPAFIEGPLSSEQAARSAKQMWGSLRYVRSIHPNILIVNNPHTWHWTTPLGPTIEKLLAQLVAQGYDVADMKLRMPMQGGAQVWKSWYNDDGHWSDHGSSVYGKAVAGVIRERMLRAHGVAPNAADAACLAAFSKFREAKSAVEAKAPGALEALGAAIALLPEDLSVRLRNGVGGYADCGFVSELFAERASLHELNGQPALATEDWKKAFEHGPDRVPVLEKRLELRLARKDEAAALLDVDELLKLQPANTDLLLKRAEILAARGEEFAKEAAEAFDEIARRRPNDLGNWFKAARANTAAKNYEAVIENANRALKIDPRHAAFYFVRYNANGALDRWEDALVDLNKVIELLPKEIGFYRLRASVLERLGRKADAGRDMETAEKLEKAK